MSNISSRCVRSERGFFLILSSSCNLAFCFAPRLPLGRPLPLRGVLARGLNSEWKHSDSTSHHSTRANHCFTSKSRRGAWWWFAFIRDAQRSLRSRLWLCNWSNDDGGLRRLRVDHLNFRRNAHLLFGARCLCHRFDHNFLFRWIWRIGWWRKRGWSGLSWSLAGGPRSGRGRCPCRFQASTATSST